MLTVIRISQNCPASPLDISLYFEKVVMVSLWSGRVCAHAECAICVRLLISCRTTRYCASTLRWIAQPQADKSR